MTSKKVPVSNVVGIQNIRRLRAELERKMGRYNSGFEYESFDNTAVVKALEKKYAKQIALLDTLPARTMGGFKFYACSYRASNGDMGYMIFEQDADKMRKAIHAVSPAFKQMEKEYADAFNKHNNAQPKTKAKKLIARLRELEVDCLLNQLSSSDPKIKALFDEARALLTLTTED
jgi:hypothetical protein